jgi:hypothetical protein
MLMTGSTSRDATVAAVAASPRRQPYRFIHKALRALMFRTLKQAATLDAARVDERAALQAAVNELLQVCSDHLAHENTFFHEPLRARAPRAVLPFDDDHQSHVQAIASLRARLAQVVEGGAAARGHAYALYLELSRFVGENLEHMADEETQLTQALWQHFSDAEIVALEDRLRASFSAQEAAYYLRWMARGLDDEELEALAQGARAGMPAPAFVGFASLILDELPASRRARLARALDLPPVPGLVAA